MTTQIDNTLQAVLHAFKPASPEPAWLTELRQDATESFLELGVPNIRHEEWRYTNLKPLLAEEFLPAAPADISAADIAPYLIEGADNTRLVFVNGFFHESLSKLPDTPKALLIQPLSRVLDSDEGLPGKLARYADHHAQPFTALNTALLTDGAYIRAGQGAVMAAPVHVIYVSTGPYLSAPRTLLVAGETADVRLIESYVGLGEGGRFVNGVTEIALHQNAFARHIRLLRETDATSHIGWNEVRQDRDSSYVGHSISLGAKIARNDVNVMLTGEGANCTLNGLVLGQHTQHFDNRIVVDHVRPRCTSRQLYRSVVDDKARSAFSGKVIVRPGAIGTDANQQNNNLLLSDDARVDTKPQLEIYCDDVKCSHGATSGQLDAAAMFFLRSRGLDYRQARNVLTYAFANDVIEHIKVVPVREHLEELMRQRFQGLLGN
jgi:Fe-S cluster assembly protein SufD